MTSDRHAEGRQAAPGRFAVGRWRCPESARSEKLPAVLRRSADLYPVAFGCPDARAIRDVRQAPEPHRNASEAIVLLSTRMSISAGPALLRKRPVRGPVSARLTPPRSCCGARHAPRWKT